MRLNAIVLACTLLAVRCAVPAQAGIAPEGEATQVRIAQPGEIYRGSIAIRNAGAAVAQVKLYQTDYAFSADGSNRFDTPGTLARSNAAWLRLNREQLSIAPYSVATVDYEVRVSSEPGLAGTYWSVVMLQELPPAEAAVRPRTGFKLQQTLRHAIQIVTELGDTGTANVAFTNASVVAKDAGHEFDVDLENVGERWLRTDVWLELHDISGRMIGRFAAPRSRTFPGTSVRNRIELGTAPAGKYLGLLVADGGRNELFGMQVELDLH